MITRYDIRRVWLRNTDKRDAFYQVFGIVAIDTGGSGAPLKVTALTVGHYGPNKVAEGRYSRPVLGGQVILYPDTVKTAAALQSEKQKRGYCTEAEHNESLIPDAFVQWVQREFGATKGFDVLQHFGLSLDGVDISAAVADLNPKPLSEDQELDELARPAPVERPAAWGTW